MRSNKGFVEVAVGLLIIGFALFVLVFGVARIGIVPIHSVYSEGERTGVVYKVSHKGFFCKTYEGEMNLGGMSTDGNGQTVPNIWYFSISDSAVAKQITERAEAGKRTTLVYTEYFANSICQGSSNHVVTGLK